MSGTVGRKEASHTSARPARPHDEACGPGRGDVLGGCASTAEIYISTRPPTPLFPGPPIDADILRIPVGPGALHVERYGRGGRQVVLLHGFGTSSFLWRAVGPRLALARCTAFAADMLGHGESDRPFDAGFGIAAQAEYLDRALTALRVARATVVGVDLGGTVALRLAATRPERVDQLVLVNPRVFDGIPGADIRAMQRNTARFALRISRGVLGAAPLLTPLLESGVADPEHMPPRLVARYLAPFVGRDGVGHLLTLARAIRDSDMESVDLGAIRAPTTVVWGAADRLFDRDIPKRLTSAIPGCRLLTFTGVGRLVPEEASEKFSSLLIELITGGASEGVAALSAAEDEGAPATVPPPA